ncbi:DNA-3-methyladenine glycosylase I [Ferrovibrio terrae]|uniref:DNA-3-methyladenine glycosylase I n=1 Tax=Ferrovibrio terrae TaxID=2594003 RepID=UPI0031379A61
MPTAFKTIRARAEKRKGAAALKKLLPKIPDQKALTKLKDDRVLAEMAKRVFSAGFVWSVIENKWDGFETAFQGFDPRKLVHKPDEFWEKLASDKRIVRNPQKIRSVRDNAQFVMDIAKEHGSFGKFLAAWPATDQIGLLELLAKRGSRLGGNTGQYLIRFLGKDSFIVSRDVLLCLRDAGLELTDKGSSKGDWKKIQAQFTAWQTESGLPLMHISRICAMSIGENYDADRLKRALGDED